MAAYYNEFNPEKAAALRALIASEFLPAGDVDERSIVDVSADDLRGYVQCHFFAGFGLWSEALRIAGFSTDRPVWTGSCPCQDFSNAGPKQAQLGSRHLWPHWFRLIRESKPATIYGEQTAAAIARGWLDDAFHDLENEENACAAAVLPALCVGSPHDRPRIWFVAQSLRTGQPQPWQCGSIAPARKDRKADSVINAGEDAFGWFTGTDGRKRPIEPGIRLLADGYPESMALLHGAGDAIHPQVAAEFIKATM